MVGRRITERLNRDPLEHERLDFRAGRSKQHQHQRADTSRDRVEYLNVASQPLGASPRGCIGRLTPVARASSIVQASIDVTRTARH